MLDKIKVYRRSDGSEIKIFELKFCYQSIEGHSTPYYNKDGFYLFGLNFTKPLFLTKSDPLNKFKKEMEGWWFCSEYVVIVDEEVGQFQIVKTTKKKIILYNTTLLREGEEFPYNKYIDMEKYDDFLYRQSCLNHYYYPVKADINQSLGIVLQEITDAYNELKEIEKEKEPDLELTPEYKFLDTILESELKDRLSVTYSIGEDKYLKLLELINF